MITIDPTLKARDLESQLQNFWNVSGRKIQLIEQEYDTSKGSPVFTWAGKYTTRGWTEWTQGFQYGAAILQFDATGDEQFLDLGRRQTVQFMAPHVSHFGVHDHGFNNVSTYGNLHRLMHEGKIERNEWERHFYELALKVSGAAQARRFTRLPDGGGYIYSFNGPHSLFVDTIRSCRALMVSYLLGHAYMDEGDKEINLLQRAIQHALATARYSVFYGEGRDSYDLRGRVAHESVFNTNDGAFRCPNSQQGYTGFSTWTRGLAWAMCGFAEELELLQKLSDEELAVAGGRSAVTEVFLKAAQATCDFYIEQTPVCGVPYWDTGAPNLHRMGNYLDRPAEPDNDWEPVDSSAAAIGAQGLLRLGKYLGLQSEAGKRYWQAGLTTARTLLSAPYLSEDPQHQGLLLHSIYHQPNGWDYVPPGKKIAQGEACMWGDYHVRELALYIQREAKGEPYYTFFSGVRS
ncbi:MAG: glycosyl hydrolase [Verrucomicrobia bacterium]|nr:glycosyl hydrolase [Verrucomicrobiota bacterium]